MTTRSRKYAPRFPSRMKRERLAKAKARQFKGERKFQPEFLPPPPLEVLSTWE